MKYFDMNHKKYNFYKSEFEYLNHGKCANVFRFYDIILKEYFSYTTEQCRLNLEMFKILKDIKNKHFIELINIYSCMDIINLLKYYVKPSCFKTDMYTARYYVDEGINVLTESINYLLDNFRELEILFEEFSKNNICTSDLKRSNSIINSNGIIIIDPDLFYISSMSQNYIITKNKKMLLDLFLDICLKCAIEEQHSKQIINKIINDLVNIEVDKNTDITYEIYKKLSYVKRPIDYLIK